MPIGKFYIDVFLSKPEYDSVYAQWKRVNMKLPALAELKDSLATIGTACNDPTNDKWISRLELVNLSKIWVCNVNFIVPKRMFNYHQHVKKNTYVFFLMVNYELPKGFVIVYFCVSFVPYVLHKLI